jgi:hypothetical protein
VLSAEVLTSSHDPVLYLLKPLEMRFPEFVGPLTTMLSALAGDARTAELVYAGALTAVCHVLMLARARFELFGRLERCGARLPNAQMAMLESDRGVSRVQLLETVRTVRPRSSRVRPSLTERQVHGFLLEAGATGVYVPLADQTADTMAADLVAWQPLGARQDRVRTAPHRQPAFI